MSTAPASGSEAQGRRLVFTVHDAERGEFCYGPQFAPVFAQFHAILDERAAGMPDQHYLAALRKLALLAPDFVDVHAHIALYWHDRGQPKKALELALAALGIANSLIPEGFNGRIEWHCTDNRPYLRAMHVALGAYIRSKRHYEAVTLIELMLARNPNDHQGVRYLRGPETLRAGHLDRALKLLQADAAEYAPNWYELALCHVMMDNYPAAATALRKGFAANFYIGEMLGGYPNPAWVPASSAMPFDDRDTALFYVGTHGALWQSRRPFFALVRWLFSHPAVLAERAGVMECVEALHWENDPTRRQQWLVRHDERIRAIDEHLSQAIIVQRPDPHGRLQWPWLHMLR